MGTIGVSYNGTFPVTQISIKEILENKTSNIFQISQLRAIPDQLLVYTTQLSSAGALKQGVSTVNSYLVSIDTRVISSRIVRDTQMDLFFQNFPLVEENLRLIEEQIDIIMAKNWNVFYKRYNMEMQELSKKCQGQANEHLLGMLV